MTDPRPELAWYAKADADLELARLALSNVDDAVKRLAHQGAMAMAQKHGRTRAAI